MLMNGDVTVQDDRNEGVEAEQLEGRVGSMLPEYSRREPVNPFRQK
jgi:hypothetical protein